MAKDEDEDVDSGWGEEEEPLGGAASPTTTAAAKPVTAAAVPAAVAVAKPVAGAGKPPAADAKLPADAKEADAAKVVAKPSPTALAPKAPVVSPTPKPAEDASDARTRPTQASLKAASPAKRPSTAPAKPASKAPPPKLAVGPRPDAKVGVPPPPRSPMMGAPLRSTEAAKSLEAPRASSDKKGSDPAIPAIDAAKKAALPPRPSQNKPTVPDRPSVLERAPKEATTLEVPTVDASGEPLSAQPKSRSFTPRVSNAVQQAKELDVRASSDPNLPTPQGTSVVAAAIAASGLRSSDRPHDRPTPLRMPSVTSREPSGEVPRPIVDAKPATTSLRFQEQPKPRLPPRDRKQTLKLTAATQNFTLELLSRETEAQVAPARPKTRVSSPMLDLHLPDDLGAPLPKAPASRDDSPEIEVSDEGQFSDSFDDLPIDEVLEAVRQSSMPPAPSSDDINLDGDSSPPRRGRAPLPSVPLISDIPLAGPESDAPPEDGPPVSDLPPTVRGDPPDALRFGPTSAGGLVEIARASDANPDGPREANLGDQPDANPDEHPDAHPAAHPDEEDPRLAPIRDRFDRGDYAGALLRAEALLEEDPNHAGAKLLVRNCQDRVKDMYISRLGSCDAVLRVVMSRERIQDLAFDHRGGFLISLIDGVATVDDVLDISGMPQLEALRLLYELKQEGVIDSSPAHSRA